MKFVSRGVFLIMAMSRKSKASGVTTRKFKVMNMVALRGVSTVQVVLSSTVKSAADLIRVKH